MCSRGYIRNSSYHYNRIGSINLSHYCYIFHGCVPDVAVPSRAVGFMDVSGKLGLFLILLCNFMMHANNRIHYGPIRLFALYTTSLLSLLFRRIWMYWNSKILARYIMSSVLLWLGRFFQTTYKQNMRLFVSCLPFSLMMFGRICVLYFIIIIKSEVWPIWHLVRVGSWNNGMRCMSFYKKVSRLRLNKMRVQKYYVENKAQLETWK